MRGAFGISERYAMNGTTVLLVDDVMTTGATANELSRICARARVQQIHVAVLARGIGVK